MNSGWIAVIVLAAGQSKRFGQNKLLTDFKGKKLIEHTLEPYINNQEHFKKGLRYVAMRYLLRRRPNTDHR